MSLIHVDIALELISNTQWSKENGLLLEAYSPLGSNTQVGKSLAVPEVTFQMTNAGQGVF